jgi:hypothetical protein
VPLIKELTTRFVGKILKREDYGGDHTGFLLSPIEAESGERPDELGFQEAKDIEPGHEP